jgi:hypothetical protein
MDNDRHCLDGMSVALTHEGLPETDRLSVGVYDKPPAVHG